MNPLVALRWVLRESRGGLGRMLYLLACLTVGVAAVVGTDALSASVRGGFEARSREILGADLKIDARRPLPESLGELLDATPGVESTRVVEAASMVGVTAEEGRVRGAQLALVTAVDGRFPLAGPFVTRPAGGLDGLLDEQSVVVQPELTRALAVDIGDTLRIGGAEFRIVGVVEEGLPEFGFSSLLGPRLYMSDTGLGRTGLLGFGTRVRYEEYVLLPDGSKRADLNALMDRVRELEGAEYLDLDPHYEVGPAGRTTSTRIEAFLGLVALLSLVVGGIGVAQITRTWVAGRTRAIAVQRCLGVRPIEILWVSLGNLAALALIGSAMGAVVGGALPSILAQFQPDDLPVELAGGVPWAEMARGVGVGLGIALVFSILPLTAIWRVPPARVLRSDASPLPAPIGVRVWAALALVAGLFLASWSAGDRADWAAWFTGGMVGLFVVLVLAARGLVALAARVPRDRLGRRLTHGVAALARPGAGTLGAVVALGLGTLVVVSMWIVDTRLRDGLLAQVPDDAPSVFLVDVQPDQWPALTQELDAAKAHNIQHVPVITARIGAIDGKEVAELVRERNLGGGGMRRLTREQRLTTMDVLPASNRLVEGALWEQDGVDELSVERRYAERLGLELGSVVRFDVQGVPVELTVTSIREVAWQSFGINFFLVVEPGVLGRAPGLLLGSARVPVGAETQLQDAVSNDFPNVTVLRLAPILEQVGSLMRRVAAGVGALGSFCVIAGLLVLGGAASAAALHRRREVALLKTLGETRGGVAGLLAVEYGLVGLVAGLVGSLGAMLLSWAFLDQVAELGGDLPWLAVPLAALACAAAAAISGLAASLRALRVPPIAALRG